MENPSHKGLVALSDHLIKVIREKKANLRIALAQLAQAEKLATLGTLGAEIAHELNNLLTIISAEADEILDSVDGGYRDLQQTAHSAQNIKSYTQRMRLIVDHIREYTWDDSNSQSKFEINAVIQDSLILLSAQLQKEDIAVKLQLDEKLPGVWGYRNKLESVFQNLISNARDALRSAGNRENKTISIYTRQINEREIAIRIQDNGCGMSEDVQRNIFQPFFTTKARGEGTGLGLAIAFTVVKEHQGNIFLHSKPGEGTEFTIVLPLERRQSKGGGNGSREKDHSRRR